jgi:phosphate transport system permease protein
MSAPAIAIDHQARLAHIRKLIAAAKRWDVLFALIGMLALSVGVVTFVALFADMLISGWARLNPDFFTSFPSRRAANAGILSAWVGSLMVMLVTALAAIPVGVAAGVYLEEYAPKNWMTDIIEINITNLAGVPSIVYGLLALGLFVYKFGFGQSVLSAGLTLALLILPIIIVATREAIRSIPQVIREGAYALGATKWQTTSDHIVPYSMPGILTGCIIGLSRAIGETAPIITIGALTFIAFLPPAPVSGAAPYVNFDWLMSGFTVMPIQMFNWTSRPEEAFQQNAAAAGVVLVVMTLSLNAIAIYVRYRLRKSIKW